jgi:pyruvate kinase
VTSRLASDADLTFTRHLPLTHAAVEFARDRHAGQRRAADGAAFVLHPLEVASLLDRSHYPDHVVAAGVLHDVLEDTDAARSELESRFGPQVGELVAAVSDDPSLPDVEERKAEVRERVRRAGGYAPVVYAADKVSKVRELRALLAGGLAGAEAEVRLLRYRKSLAMLEETIPGSRVVELLRFELEALEELPPAAGEALAKSTATATKQRSSEELRVALEQLRAEVVAEGSDLFERWRPRIKRAGYLPSARNLAHYIALRRHELRELQLELMPWGLSSLGRCEARVVESLDAVIDALARFDPASPAPEIEPSPVDFFEGHAHLRDNTEAALGPTPIQRGVRIMVTLPSEAASDFELVRRLLGSGTDVCRINCAHDDAEAWRSMVGHIRRAETELGRSCRVCMDLTGPRARTSKVMAPGRVRLQPGDRVLMAPSAPPSPGQFPVAFECSLAEVFERLAPGHSVWVDEGRLGMVVEEMRGDGALLRVTDTRPKGSRLRSGKGMNFPDTELGVTPLTAKDREDLDVIAELADAVGYSFVQRPGDIALLQDELARRLERPETITLVTKIETRLAVRNLPELIVQAAGTQPLAVMIARGDLAVEVGYRRMAELQEEILWLCESAHVPVIWATQVLDRFVHKGVGARAEITDAAMAERAECVMLNKGPFVVDAVHLLTDMLSTMEGHQFKKASRMRALHAW